MINKLDLQTTNTAICPYLFLSLGCSCHDDVVALVVIYDAHRTDTHLVGATPRLQRFVVLGADHVLQLTHFDHLVSFPGVELLVSVEMSLAVGLQAVQTGLAGLAFPPDAGRALHLPGSREVLLLNRWSFLVCTQRGKL